MSERADVFRQAGRARSSVLLVVQKHVMDHARELVEENPVLIDGRPHHPYARGGEWVPLRSHPRWTSFYVCPKTGLLRETPHTRRKRAA